MNSSEAFRSIDNGALKCANYPTVDATSQCDYCMKILCSECRIIYERDHSEDSYNGNATWYSEYSICPACYNSKIKK
ncbi:MAG: hypothetical protein ACFFAS_16345 [Promethearchaeota archaeon]